MRCIKSRVQIWLVFFNSWFQVVVVVVDFGFMTLLTSQFISVASYSEREKSDKFCSEALISAWGSFTCRKSTTRDPRLYYPSEGSHTQDFYALKKNPRTPAGFEPANLGSSGEYDNHWTTGVFTKLLLRVFKYEISLYKCLVWRLKMKARIT